MQSGVVQSFVLTEDLNIRALNELQQIFFLTETCKLTITASRKLAQLLLRNKSSICSRGSPAGVPDHTQISGLLCHQLKLSTDFKHLSLT